MWKEGWNWCNVCSLGMLVGDGHEFYGIPPEVPL